MSIGLSFFVGMLFKFYDDFVDDDPYITDEYIVKILQYIQVASLTLLLSNDFVLTILFLLFNAASAVSNFKEYARPHVFAYFFLCPLLLVASWKKQNQTFGFWDMFVIWAILIGAFLETRYFTEEFSVEKWGFRFLLIIVHTTVGLGLPLSQSVTNLCMWIAGYSLASSLAQMVKVTGLCRLDTRSDVKSG